MVKSIKQRLQDGESALVMFFGALPSPKIIEIVGQLGGLHGIFLDQEHSGITHEQMTTLMMACRAANLDGFARVAPTDYTAVMRPMEVGASGIMAAQIRTVEQTREVVQWAKYPPIGVRGLYMGNYEAQYGKRDCKEHIERSNRENWLSIQIETHEAVECVEEIAAIDGVDNLFVGPGDLACSLGVPGEVMHPRCIEALERVSKAVQAVGKHWGCLARGPEHAKVCRDLGCQLYSIVGDIELIQRGFQATKDLYPDFF